MAAEDEIGQLLSNASTAWSTASGIARHWWRPELTGRGFHRYLELRRRVAVGFASLAASSDSEEPTPEVAEDILRVAADRRATRRRIEVISRSANTWMPQTVVIDGDTFWARTGATVATNGGDPSKSIGAGTEILTMLAPEQWTGGLNTSVITVQETVAGRACVTLEAVRTDDDQAVPLPGPEMIGMIAGGDSFRLSIDNTTGVVLRAVKLVDDEPAEVCEFLEITLNQPLAEDAFDQLD